MLINEIYIWNMQIVISFLSCTTSLPSPYWFFDRYCQWRSQEILWGGAVKGPWGARYTGVPRRGSVGRSPRTPVGLDPEDPLTAPPHKISCLRHCLQQQPLDLTLSSIVIPRIWMSWEWDHRKVEHKEYEYECPLAPRAVGRVESNGLRESPPSWPVESSPRQPF